MWSAIAIGQYFVLGILRVLLLLGWEDYFGMTCKNCSPDLHYRIDMKQNEGAVVGCFLGHV